MGNNNPNAWKEGDTKSTYYKHQKVTVVRFWSHYEKRKTKTHCDNWKDLWKNRQMKRTITDF